MKQFPELILREMPDLVIGKPNLNDGFRLEYTDPGQPLILKVEYISMCTGIMIWNLCVDEALRNQGIGSSVVRVLKQICLEEQLSFLAAYRILGTATHFWEAQGFEVTGPKKDAVWRPQKS